jgi:hypothetical protein
MLLTALEFPTITGTWRTNSTAHGAISTRARLRLRPSNGSVMSDKVQAALFGQDKAVSEKLVAMLSGQARQLPDNVREEGRLARETSDRRVVIVLEIVAWARLAAVTEVALHSAE